MDYDVIVVGGGINGLTAAAYLAKAGARVLVLEARSECGAHCNSEEVTGGGFIHNLHATWLITAISPAMEDLELEKYGLEVVTTQYVYAKAFENGKCCLIGLNPQDTYANWAKLSPEDADFILKTSEVVLEKWDDILNWVHTFIFEAPDTERLESSLGFVEEILKKLGKNIPATDVLNMNGFQALDLFLKSDYTKTTIASLSWIGAFPPIHRKIGSAGCIGLVSLAGPVFAVHQAKGGSHALTHALVRCCKANGVRILTNAPVEKILVDESGNAYGVQLSPRSAFPCEKITAKKIISDLTLNYTFQMIDEDKIPPRLRTNIKLFNYDEQVIFGIHYALSGPPEFKASEFDDGIQRCFMGYIGGDTVEEMKLFAVELISGVIPERIMANWFVPSLADPTQAPEGSHTAFLWLDVPPIPVRWRDKPLPYDFKVWDEIKWEVASALTELFEKYAPGLKAKILDVFPYSPLDVWRNNPSAIRGNWCGGSVIPDQFFTLRPIHGVCTSGASRTFIKNLYLSNSIHPHGATWLASGYICAGEVAEDMGIRDRKWWRARAVKWYVENMPRFGVNRGVPEKWKGKAD